MRVPREGSFCRGGSGALDYGKRHADADHEDQAECDRRFLQPEDGRLVQPEEKSRLGILIR